MAFFVYIAILLVSISGILLELDWLTKPKLENKSPAQMAATALTPKTPAKVERPNSDLNPVYPKIPDEPRVAAPSTTGTLQPTADNASVDTSQAEPTKVQAERTPSPAQATTESKRLAETTGSAPANESVNTSASSNTHPATQHVAPVTPAPPAQTASIAAPNRCEVQACAAAYASFRASDCTYQPFEGPRRLCEKPPAARSKRTARPRGSSDEARDVEAAMRRIRPSTALRDRDDMDDDEDADFAPTQGGQRVIIIERSAPRPW